MKDRILRWAPLLVVLSILVWAGWTQIGTRNVVSGWVGTVTIAKVHVNTASTGTGVSLAGKIGAGLVAVVGVRDNVADSVYLVLQDSGTVTGWTARDSVPVDSVDSKVYKMHYVPTTGALKVRGLFRATAAATDSIHVGALIMAACQRVPC